MKDLQNTDKKFMELALEESKSSPCVRAERRVGCIAVKNGKIISKCANGAFGKMPPCSELGFCIRTKMGIPSGERLEYENCVHAEQRMICEAARDGHSLKGADIYVTHLPCAICIRLLITTEVARVFYKYDYPSQVSKDFAKQAGLQLIQID
ncbi:MAG: cytidine deaminase [Christensenellaceae bacterium]|jgi:dCMP deaminase|nr:cytidine deaminase [Christensenellaceae bacterium]